MTEKSCECGTDKAHYCMTRHEFVGDPTMSALEWEMEFGDDAPEDPDGPASSTHFYGGPED